MQTISKIIVYSDYVIKFNIKCKTNNKRVMGVKIARPIQCIAFLAWVDGPVSKICPTGRTLG